jgi:hypothetical protein
MRVVTIAISTMIEKRPSRITPFSSPMLIMNQFHQAARVHQHSHGERGAVIFPAPLAAAQQAPALPTQEAAMTANATSNI